MDNPGIQMDAMMLPGRGEEEMYTPMTTDRKWTRPESWTIRAEQQTTDRKWTSLESCVSKTHKQYVTKIKYYIHKM